MFSHAHFHIFPHSRPVQGPFPTSVSLEASAMPGVLAACRLPNSKTHGVVVSQAISHNCIIIVYYYSNIIVLMVKPRCHLTNPFPSISSVHIVLFCLYRSLVQTKIPVGNLLLAQPRPLCLSPKPHCIQLQAMVFHG